MGALMGDAATRYRKWIVTGALAVGVGLGAYGIAGAATSTTTKPQSPASPSFHSNENTTHEKSESAQREADENSGKFSFHGGRDGGPGGQETVVSGAVAAKIKAAALKTVPGTVTKTEQRADGTYEAEITKSDGTEVHVSLDKNFKVLTMRGPGGDGHDHGGFGRGAWDGGPPSAPGGAPSA
jgi:uncharacterized membrane protein YkoI